MHRGPRTPSVARVNAPRQEAGSSTRTFLVEHYWPGVTVEAFAEAVRRVREAMEGLRGQGEPIRPMSSTLVPQDEAAYWVVDAPSMDLVELAYARAGVPYERILVAYDLDAARGHQPGIDGRREG